MVEENGELPDERKAVTAYAEKLQKEVLPNRTVCFLHGKMKAKEKETVMRAFAAGEIDVLVSTTVVEVGVDVPNASRTRRASGSRSYISCAGAWGAGHGSRIASSFPTTAARTIKRGSTRCAARRAASRWRRRI